MMETQHQASAVPPKVRTKTVDPDAPRGRSPLTGAPVPPGRQKGVPNRVTRTIREAVEIAARDCHPKGLAGWLIERAQGGIQDRQIFAAMVNKAMPLQVQANVDGGIRLELGWLSQRQIGTPTAQVTEQKTQVLDLQRESDGSYRIRDQKADAAPVAEPVERARSDREGEVGHG